MVDSPRSFAHPAEVDMVESPDCLPSTSFFNAPAPPQQNGQNNQNGINNQINGLANQLNGLNGQFSQPNPPQNQYNNLNGLNGLNGPSGLTQFNTQNGNPAYPCGAFNDSPRSQQSIQSLSYGSPLQASTSTNYYTGLPHDGPMTDYDRLVEQRKQNGYSQVQSPIERPTSTATDISQIPDLTNVAMGGNDFVSIEYNDPPFWATISYYEKKQRIGDSYQVTKPSVIIDGFTSPSDEDRMCLGQLTNVQRNPEIVEARKYIGKHIRYNIDTTNLIKI